MNANQSRSYFSLSTRLLLTVASYTAAGMVFGCGAEVTSPPRAIPTGSEENQKDAQQETKTDSSAKPEDINAAEPESEVAKAIRRMSEADPLDVRTLMNYGELFYSKGDMKNAVTAYDKVLEIRPDVKPQLWQRGLALYYAEEYERGVDQFNSHQTLNTQDVENSVWHLLCQTKLTSVEKARQSMIQIRGDSRVPMRQVFEMFAGTGSPQKVLEACGYEEGKPRESSPLYHGLIYVGLYHEMMGDPKASIDAMEKAVQCKPPMYGLMSHVAASHLKMRKPAAAEPQR